jgi:hypothetical protein
MYSITSIGSLPVTAPAMEEAMYERVRLVKEFEDVQQDSKAATYP